MFVLSIVLLAWTFGSFVQAFCPSVKESCESSSTCHWDEFADKCVSSLPCALESSRASCNSNTWDCVWRYGTCSKRVQASHGVACRSKDNSECDRDKTCRWLGNRCEIRPTIVLSLADDLGWYDVGWNNPRARTPVLDALRNQAVSFERHYASRFCAPSRGMILAGVLPWKNGLQTDLNLNPVNSLRCAVSKDKDLIPQVLKEMGGYSTHMYGKWHLGNYGEDVIPTGRGFDTFDGYYGGGIVNHSPPDQFQSVRCACRSSPKRLNRPGVCSRTGKKLCVKAMNMLKAVAGEKEQVVDSEAVKEVTTDLYLARRVEERLRKLDPDTPAFFYLSFSTPHNPIFATQQFMRTVEKSRPPFGTDAPLNKRPKLNCSSDRRLQYLAMITMLDEAHRIVIDTMESVGRFHSSVFVFTSDNGGHLPTRGMDGRTHKCSLGFNYPLRGGKFAWWEGGIRVVSFLASKRWIPRSLQGTSSDSLTSLVDWRKTLVAASGGNARSIDDDGVNLWGMVTGDASEERDHLALQVWLEKRRFVLLFKYGGELWKIIWGNPSSGRGSGHSGKAIKNYSRGEIEQPPELPRGEVTYPLHNGYWQDAHCRRGCMYNLSKDPQELINLSRTRRDVKDYAISLRNRYAAEGIPLKSTTLCEKAFFSRPTRSVTDRSSIDRARKCKGFVSWLDGNGQLKDSC